MGRSAEEELIRRYFDAFNRQDVEGVMACFHDEPHVVNAAGARLEGRDAVRRRYEEQFALFPDGRCDLRSTTVQAGCGTAESRFVGTEARSGRSFTAVGAEVLEFQGGRIKALRDGHRVVADEPEEPSP